MSDLSLSWRDTVARLLDPDLGRRRLVVGAVLGAFLLVAGGAFIFQNRTAPVELALPRAAAGASATTDAGTTGDTTAQPAVGDERPVAHAAGAVVHPGVYRLDAGARVADLLAAAGGPAPEADLDAINLAAKVADGDRIYVPRHGEVPVGTTAAGSAGGGSASGGVVNLNTASVDELDSLPGVGPATAQAILDYRRQHGKFRSVDQLLEVRGIGDAKLRQIRPRVRV